jgi:hypothetical protein
MPQDTMGGMDTMFQDMDVGTMSFDEVMQEVSIAVAEIENVGMEVDVVEIKMPDTKEFVEVEIKPEPKIEVQQTQEAVEEQPKEVEVVEVVAEQPKEEAVKEEAPKEEAPKEEAAPLDNPTDAGDFSTAAYEKEVADNGKLSEDSYADLAKKGFTKQQVDQYIHGQTAYADTVKKSVYDKVGGEQQYSELMDWASANMPEDVINDYNDSVNALDTNRVMRNLEYMAMKQQQGAPQQTRRLEGDSPAEGMQPFADKNQWQLAQQNRLYGKDAKYTNMVDKRFLASRKRGIL